ncbi:MAG: hypothetical protein AB7G93_06090 [Bdellovibrionales bacterium]
MERSTDQNFDRTSISNAMNSEPTREGGLTRRVENVTAKVPSMAYLGLAVGSMVLSASIAAFSERKSMANFVGLWAPSFLLIGIYNKLVKLEGSDRESRSSSNAGLVH